MSPKPIDPALSAPSTRIPLDLRQFPWTSRLTADYAYDFAPVAPFFSGNPAVPSAWASAIARAQSRSRRPDEIATIVATQQRKRGAPARAIEAGRTLADPRTVAIITGQQAGLFGGPLYTLLKALTALKLAEQVARQHGVPTVAVFWIDAEDHDWDEVRSCTVFDDTLNLHSIELPRALSAEQTPIASVRLDDSILGALDELERILPATEFRADVLRLLRESYAPGTGMADGFGRWLERVLGDRGLVLYDSSDPASKGLVSQLFARELSTAGETSRLASAAGAALVEHGYHTQVHAQADALALFRLDGRRKGIRHVDGQLTVGDETFTPATLVQEAIERPTGFSPNVLLRPLVQDTVFPTICYVAGPSELAYLGQLRNVYEHFGLPMPLVYPRATATLLDSASIRFLNKCKLPFEALQAQDEAALNALLTSMMPEGVEDAFTAAAQAIESRMATVTRAAGTVDPTLEGAAKSTLGRMQSDLQSLHGKLVQAAKRRDDTLRRQFMRARALAFPGGHPQERTIGFVWFLNQYGPTLVDRLIDELPLELGRHWIVTI